MSIVIKWELKKEDDEYVLVQSYESVEKKRFNVSSETSRCPNRGHYVLGWWSFANE